MISALGFVLLFGLAPFIGALIHYVGFHWTEIFIQHKQDLKPKMRLHRLISALVMTIIALTIMGTKQTDHAHVIISFFLGSMLLLLSIIDAYHFILPNSLTLSLLVAGFIKHLLFAPAYMGIELYAVTALIAYSVFFAANYGYATIRKREGLGGGDAKLLAAGCFWVEPQEVALVVLLATIMALITIIGFSLATRRTSVLSDRLPFGPYLSIGIWIVWITGT